MTARKFRRELYRSARLLGDLGAAAQGPTAYAKRRARRVVFRQTGTLGRRISKALGL